MDEAREILDRRQKDGELSFEQQRAYEYSQQFSYLDKKKAKELAKDLEKLGFLNEAQVQSLVDLLPVKPAYVKAATAFGGEPLSDDQVKQAVDVIKKFKPK
ncbi:hypothetical protein AUJ15_00075 [Candidatus Micrarchaeota archaeon CG1_02_55_41]|nr:MAG: hypothetical protein AUJ15_00075 [Candidatus Micrarchaeota archaeon CG1_02_55_41]